MIISIKKFGTTLVSRPAGKEAYLAFQPVLGHELSDTEDIVVDFEGVAVLTPSWIDEFLTPLLKTYSTRVKLVNTTNASVQASLKILSIPF